MEQNRISVITCTLNSEKFIEDNLKSVWNAEPKPFEQIIVDGFSKDKTLKIVEKYKKNGNNIRIFQIEPKGISDAMNFGIQNSKGDIIQILHSDDYLINKSAFGIVSERFLKSNIKWLYGRSSIGINKNNRWKVINNKTLYEGINYRVLLPFICNIPHQSSFVLKEVFDKYGLFDTNLKFSMDWDFWIRIREIKTEFLDRNIAAFRLNKNSTTIKNKDTLEYNKELIGTVKKNYKFPFNYLAIFILVFLIIPLRLIFLKLRQN